MRCRSCVQELLYKRNSVDVEAKDVHRFMGLSMCFFFQAEDGIRDKLVTGVQTCALPISVAMRLEWFSRAVPLLSAAALTAAGAIQFTRWKMTHLLRCRSPLGCAISCPEDRKSVV